MSPGLPPARKALILLRLPWRQRKVQKMVQRLPRGHLGVTLGSRRDTGTSGHSGHDGRRETMKSPSESRSVVVVVGGFVESNRWELPALREADHHSGAESRERRRDVMTQKRRTWANQLALLHTTSHCELAQSTVLLVLWSGGLEAGLWQRARVQILRMPSVRVYVSRMICEYSRRVVISRQGTAKKGAKEGMF